MKRAVRFLILLYFQHRVYKALRRGWPGEVYAEMDRFKQVLAFLHGVEVPDAF